MAHSDSIRDIIIRAVQKRADTKNRRIDAAVVSRVASMTLDEVMTVLGSLFKRRK